MDTRIKRVAGDPMHFTCGIQSEGVCTQMKSDLVTMITGAWFCTFSFYDIKLNLPGLRGQLGWYQPVPDTP